MQTPVASLTSLPSELLTMILRELLPPEQPVYNITEFDALANTIATSNNRIHQIATSIFPQNLRLQTNQDLSTLATFFTRIGPTNIPKIHSILIDLGQIPPLDRILDNGFEELIRCAFRAPDLTRMLYVATTSNGYQSRLRLQHYFFTLGRAVRLAEQASSGGLGEAAFTARYLLWRKAEIDKLRGAEARL